MKKFIFILAIFFQISFLFSEQYQGQIEVINDQDYFPRVLKAIQEAKKSIYLHYPEKGIWEGYITKSYRFTFSSAKEEFIFRNVGPHGIIDKRKV